MNKATRGKHGIKAVAQSCEPKLPFDYHGPFYRLAALVEAANHFDEIRSRQPDSVDPASGHLATVLMMLQMELTDFAAHFEIRLGRQE